MKILGLYTIPIIIILSGFTAISQQTKVSPGNIEIIENSLHATAVFVSDDIGVIIDPLFRFGQQVSINFIELENLIQINGKYYPNLDITLISKKGDSTVLKNSFGLDNAVAAMPNNYGDRYIKSSYWLF